MPKTTQRTILREKRKRTIRKRLAGTPARPRLAVHRTLKHIYAQIIDDTTGQTLLASSSIALKVPGANIDAAKTVGTALGQLATEKEISRVCFDRGGHLYHGRVKALADAAREAGLEF